MGQLLSPRETTNTSLVEKKNITFKNTNKEDRYKNAKTQNTKSGQHIDVEKGEKKEVNFLKRINSSYLTFSFLFGLCKQTSSEALTSTHTQTLTQTQKDMFVINFS